jgi:hypothetical protein
MALIGRLKMWLAAFGAAIAAVGWAYLKGRNDADNANELDDHNEYIATRKRMDAIEPADDVTEWLRERAKRDGNL